MGSHQCDTVNKKDRMGCITTESLMGWNGMSSRSLAPQSWQKVIAVDTDQLCERLSGYSLGLFIVKGATACEQRTQAEWTYTD